MHRRILVLALLIFSPLQLMASSCPHAVPTHCAKFCETFRNAAKCHCTSSGLPQGMCSDVKLLYKRLITTFGTLERTCEFQRDTTKENCIDSWHCYLNGGVNTDGKPCNDNGNPCA